MRALGLALAVVLLLGTAPASAEPVVVTAGDAVKAQAGRDYTRLAALGPDRAGQVVEVTAEGQLVMGPDDGSRYWLLDPQTGRRSSFPEPGRPSTLVELTADRIWFARSDQGRFTVYRFDRDARRMERFRLPEASQRPRHIERVIGFVGDTVWFTTGDRTEHFTEDVWSVRFRDSDTLTREGRQLGLPSLNHGLLASTEYGQGEEPGALVQRDLATGETSRTPLPDGCRPVDTGRPQVGGTHVTLDVWCPDARNEGETFVVDRNGEITAILDVEPDEGNLGTVDRGVFIHRYFYDFATARLLTITGLKRLVGTRASGPGDHPVQVWPRRDGRSLVVRLK